MKPTYGLEEGEGEGGEGEGVSSGPSTQPLRHALYAAFSQSWGCSAASQSTLVGG